MDTTRRSLLATIGGTTAVGLAGCLGGASGSDAGDCDIPDSAESVQEMPIPTLGPDDAAVTVKVWEDFSCPHCATFALEVFPQIRSNFIESGDVRYHHHDWPLPVNQQWSWAIPNAARGVQESMDDETFFEFAKLMFENQGDYSFDLVQEQAEAVGADGCDIRGDAINEPYRPVLEADAQRAQDRGAGGTPAVYVNGTSVRPTWEDVRAAIESEL